MTEQKTKSCPFCGEEILDVAVKCKHCQSMLNDSGEQATPAPVDDDYDPELEQLEASLQANSPSTGTLKNMFLPPLIVFVICFSVLFFGNFHVVTGGQVGFQIFERRSFGFSEVFVNVDQIGNMPAILAKGQYPIGTRLLQDRGILENSHDARGS